MTLTLIGTEYSQVTRQERGFRAVIGVNDSYRVSLRWFVQEEAAMSYGRRLFKKLESSGRWEPVVPQIQSGSAKNAERVVA